jgi:hypothetical protein
MNNHETGRFLTLLLAAGLLSLAFGACSRRAPQPGPATSRFQAGQVWAFKTPASQPNAKLIILRVENYGGEVGTIVHVAVTGVRYGGNQTLIPHLPFVEAAVTGSVTTMEREPAPLPDYSEGYGEWRKAFDAGKGGAFSITVAEVVDAVTNVTNQVK